MREGWVSGGRQTACGAGSTKERAAEALGFILRWIGALDILHLTDAGAGDMNWIKGKLPQDVLYRPYDLVQRRAGVTPWDISKVALPRTQMILCRDVLIHMDPPRVAATLALFKESADYLIATQHDNATGFCTLSPFNIYDLRPHLGPYIAAVAEPLQPGDIPGKIALWRLK